MKNGKIKREELREMKKDKLKGKVRASERERRGVKNILYIV